MHPGAEWRSEEIFTTRRHHRGRPHHGVGLPPLHPQDTGHRRGRRLVSKQYIYHTVNRLLSFLSSGHLGHLGHLGHFGHLGYLGHLGHLGHRGHLGHLGHIGHLCQRLGHSVILLNIATNNTTLGSTSLIRRQIE